MFKSRSTIALPSRGSFLSYSYGFLNSTSFLLHVDLFLFDSHISLRVVRKINLVKLGRDLKKVEKHWSIGQDKILFTNKEALFSL